jgi:hypothetical protein
MPGIKNTQSVPSKKRSITEHMAHSERSLARIQSKTPRSVRQEKIKSYELQAAQKRFDVFEKRKRAQESAHTVFDLSRTSVMTKAVTDSYSQSFNEEAKSYRSLLQAQETLQRAEKKGRLIKDSLLALLKLEKEYKQACEHRKKVQKNLVVISKLLRTDCIYNHAEYNTKLAPLYVFTDSKGNTPFHHFAQSYPLGRWKALPSIAFGIDPKCSNDMGKTPLDLVDPEKREAFVRDFSRVGLVV